MATTSSSVRTSVGVPLITSHTTTNKILETGYDKDGTSRKYQQTVGEAKVIYQKGGAIGDIYAGDFMRDANGHIVLTAKGEPTSTRQGSNDRFLGNMNSKWQMG